MPAISSVVIAKKLREAHSPEVIDVLRELLVESLSPRHKQVYACILAGRTTTQDIAEVMGLNINHIGTLTKQLLDLGLVSRDEAENGGGRWFEYRPKGILLPDDAFQIMVGGLSPGVRSEDHDVT